MSLSRPGIHSPCNQAEDPRPLALVILAAGASKRLGTCKALVNLGAGPCDTPLARLLEAARVLHHARPLLLTGKHDRELRQAAPPQLERLFNQRWEEGRTGSVALAAEARAGSDLLLAPVDVPRVPAAVFGALAKAWQAAGCPPRGWLAPCLLLRAASDGSEQRRFGHPVVIGRELAAELARLLHRPHDPPSGKSFPAGKAWRSQSLRHWRRAAEPLLFVQVEAPEILEDLDSPEDLARLRAL